MELYRIWLPVSLGLHLLLLPALSYIHFMSPIEAPNELVMLDLSESATKPLPEKPVVRAATALPAVLRSGHQPGRRINPVAGPRTAHPRLPGPQRTASTPRPRLGVYHPPRRLAPARGPLRMSQPTLGQMGQLQDQLPGASNQGQPIAAADRPAADVPEVKIGNDAIAALPTPHSGGLGNRPGRGTGLGNEDEIPVLGNAPTLSPVNSAPNATIAPAFVPGNPNGIISPNVALRAPAVPRNLPDGSPDGTPGGRGNAPVGPDVAISTGGGGGTGGEASRPSYGARALGGPTPDFPMLASKEGLSGTVVVLVTLNNRGKVIKAQPTRASDTDVLDNAAVRAAKRWTYRPSMENGVPVGGTVRLKFVFQNQKVVVTPL